MIIYCEPILSGKPDCPCSFSDRFFIMIQNTFQVYFGKPFEIFSSTWLLQGKFIRGHNLPILYYMIKLQFKYVFNKIITSYLVCPSIGSKNCQDKIIFLFFSSKYIICTLREHQRTFIMRWVKSTYKVLPVFDIKTNKV